MVRTIRSKALLALIVGIALIGAVPARAADNDGLAADFGGFGAGGMVADAPLEINDTALLPDGRIVAVGTKNNTVAMARYLAHGTLDTGFGANGLVVVPVTETQTSASAHSVVLQPDGKIVVAGEVAGAAGNDFAVLRFAADGALDASFGTNGKVTIDWARSDDSARALAITSDKRIIVGGWTARGGNDDFAVVALTPSGALDAGFGTNGKLAVNLGQHERIYDLLVQPNDKLLLLGNSADTKSEVVRIALARLTPSGELDTTFDGDGQLLLLSHSANARSLALTSEGKIVVAGDAIGKGFLLARLMPSGALDSTFNGDGLLVEPFGGESPGARAALILEYDSILVAGRGDDRLALVRYDNEGKPDRDFGASGRVFLDGAPADAGLALLRTRDGRLLLGGGRQLAQLFYDGALDAGGRQLSVPLVATGARVAVRGDGASTLVQPDGRIVSAGTVHYGRIGYDLVVARHLPNGLPDPSFGAGGTQTFGIDGLHDDANDALLQPDGGVVVVGTSSVPTAEPTLQNINLLVGRLDDNGAPDERCGDAGIAVHDFGAHESAQSVALQADGKLVVAGYLSGKMQYETFVARFDERCALDTTFDGDGIKLLGYGAQVADVQALPDGKLLVIGMTEDALFLARFTANGAPDPSFGTDGKVTKTIGTYTGAIAAAALPGGETLVLLHVYDKGQIYTLLARYTANGTLDSTFGKEGLAVVDLGEYPVPSALAVRDDGAIAVAGCSDERLSQPVVLLDANGKPNRAFSGDGKTELLVGDYTCLTETVFSGTRLVVGGYALSHGQGALALATYDLGDGACCAPQRVGFAAETATVAENAVGATLDVRLSQTSAQTVTVRYAATGGTATNGADYTLSAGALTFAPGQTSQRIRVALQNDQAAEGDETIEVTLGSSSNAELGDAFSTTLTIADDEAPAPPTPNNPVFLPLVRR